MSEIKAIETVYNGYRFRSRLEARWAVFFDAMGIKYEYEQEGFEFGDRDKYLPDFFLPDFEMFVEVKNSSAFTFAFNGDYVHTNDGTENGDMYLRFANEITKNGNTYLLVFGDPIDAFMSKEHSGKGDNILFFREECAVHSIMSKAVEQHPEMEFKSDHGDCKRCENFLHDMGLCKMLMLTQDTAFIPYSGSSERHTVPYVKNYIPIIPPKEAGAKLEKFFSQCIALLESYSNDFMHAIKQARQARFEYGETPTV